MEEEKNSDNAYEHKKDYFATATTEAEQKTNSSCLCASSYGSFFADACVYCNTVVVQYNNVCTILYIWTILSESNITTTERDMS